MEQKYIQLITAYPYFCIMSEKSQQPYIDQHLRVYLFDTEREASVFSSSMEGLTYAPERYFKQAPFCGFCYGSGITTIRVKLIRRQDFIDVPVTKKDVRRGHYNPIAKAALLRLKQTAKRRYMNILSSALFLTPVVPSLRKRGEYPAIQYGLAKAGDAQYMLLFTSIPEFDAWNDKQKTRYFPVEMSLPDLSSVRQGRAVYINPCSDRIVLSDKQIKEISHEKSA